MGSTCPKVLVPVCGVPMLDFVVEALSAAGLKRIVVVIGRGASDVVETFEGRGLEFVVQAERLGTAHAVAQALPSLRVGPGEVVIAPGDAPMLTAGHVTGLLHHHSRERSDLSLLAARVEDPGGLGRIVRGADGGAVSIAEELDASDEERLATEVNVGLYCVARPVLSWVIPMIGNNNRKGEYYLTDMVRILADRAMKVSVCIANPPPWPVGVNTPTELQMAEEALRARRT